MTEECVKRLNAIFCGPVGRQCFRLSLSLSLSLRIEYRVQAVVVNSASDSLTKGGDLYEYGSVTNS